MSFGTGKSQSTQQSLASQQSAIGSTLNTEAQGNLAQGQALLQPATQFYSNIINAGKSGNYSDLLAAAGPTISNITGNNLQAQESIYNTQAPGAGRDFALATSKMNESGQIASTLNNLYTSAFPALAQIGQAQTATGLSEQSQSTANTEAAFGSTTQIYKEQAASKANFMSTIGSIVGGIAGGPIGGAITGRIAGAIGGGGGGATDPLTASTLNSQANTLPSDIYQFPNLSTPANSSPAYGLPGIV